VEAIRTHRPVREHVELAVARAVPDRLLPRPGALRPHGVLLRRLAFFTWRLLPWKDILTVRGGGPRRRLRFLLRDGTAYETCAELTTLDFHRLQITVQQRQLATVFE
jgi:hypothetical protein